MTTLARLLIALRNSLPLYSRRQRDSAWCAGYFAALRVRRGQHGKFTRLRP